jgi:hypothetical protein
MPNIAANIQTALDFWSFSMNEIMKILLLSPEEFKDGAIWRLILSIHNVMQAIAYALLVIFFLVGTLKTAASIAEIKRAETVVNMLIRLLIAKGVITYSLDILGFLFDIVRGSIRSARSIVVDSGAIDETEFYPQLEIPAEVLSATKDAGLLTGILLWLISIIGILVVLGCSFSLILTIYGRLFKLFLYSAISPIPLSTFGGIPTQNVGYSFLRSYAAICMEGLVIFLSCAIFSAMSREGVLISLPISVGSDNAQIILKYFIELTITFLTLNVTIKTSNQVVREMMGL